ncbi:MAG: NERD domain-containing protein [Ruminococcus sp.]|nr:NERD domain-containing protein [Ruminococcus sp.]
MQTTYYKATKRLFFTGLLLDKGAYGEYKTYSRLRSYENAGAKFLFNVYLPSTSKYTDTTEIDVLMISDRGVFVFESKNYSGWIFGNDKQKMWTQCLPQGKGRQAIKEKFFNPVWQNNAHIKALRNLIQSNTIPVYSLIVFSERCTLKEISLYNSPNTTVLNRNELNQVVENVYSYALPSLDQGSINTLYSLLLPHSQVSDAVKQQHIEQINSRK